MSKTKVYNDLPVITVTDKDLQKALNTVDVNPIVIKSVSMTAIFPNLDKNKDPFTITAELIKLPLAIRFSMRVFLRWRQTAENQASDFHYMQINGGLVGDGSCRKQNCVVKYDDNNILTHPRLELCKFFVDSESKNEGYIFDIGELSKLKSYAVDHSDVHPKKTKVDDPQIMNFRVNYMQPLLTPHRSCDRAENSFQVSFLANSIQPAAPQRRQKAKRVHKQEHKSYQEEFAEQSALYENALAPYSSSSSSSNSRDNKDGFFVEYLFDYDDGDVQELDPQFVPKRQRPSSELELELQSIIKRREELVNYLNSELTKANKEKEEAIRLRHLEKQAHEETKENLTAIKDENKTFKTVLDDARNENSYLYKNYFQVRTELDRVRAQKSGECVVCTNPALRVKFEPCRHVCVCIDCVKKLSSCPICTKRFTGCEIVYVS